MNQHEKPDPHFGENPGDIVNDSNRIRPPLVIDSNAGLAGSVLAIAARRGTTLKAIIAQALEREVHDRDPPQDLFEVDKDGLPHLPSRALK